MALWVICENNVLWWVIEQNWKLVFLLLIARSQSDSEKSSLIVMAANSITHGKRMSNVWFKNRNLLNNKISSIDLQSFQTNLVSLEWLATLIVAYSFDIHLLSVSIFISWKDRTILFSRAELSAIRNRSTIWRFC